MGIEVVFAIAGVICLIYAIIGKNIKFGVKDLNVEIQDALKVWQRTVFFIFGVLFVVVALWPTFKPQSLTLQPEEKQTEQSQPKENPVVAQETTTQTAPTESPKTIPTESPNVATSVPSTTGTNDTTWHGEYFNNIEFSGSPVFQRDDDFIEFNFPDLEEILAKEIEKDDFFSVRWTRCLEFDSGVYTFSAMADDTLEAWIDDDTPIINTSALMGANLRKRELYIPEGNHCLRVDFRENTGGALVIFNFNLSDATQSSSSVWHGEYFNNTELSGSPVYERDYAYIDFEWGLLGGPGPEVGADGFSIRWTQCLDFGEDTYIFRARGDDNIKVFLDNEDILDVSASEGIKEVTLPVSEGKHCLEVQFIEYSAHSSAYFDFRTE